jgi:hypothetical protein
MTFGKPKNTKEKKGRKKEGKKKKKTTETGPACCE